MDDFLYGEHPNAEKYKTKAVKNYLDSVIYFNKMKGKPEKKETILSPERTALYRKLSGMLDDSENYRGTDTLKFSPRYADPVTGEIFAFDTGMARLINNLCFAYAGNVSNEEIIDIFEGFNKTVSKAACKNRRFCRRIVFVFAWFCTDIYNLALVYNEHTLSVCYCNYRTLSDDIFVTL